VHGLISGLAQTLARAPLYVLLLCVLALNTKTKSILLFLPPFSTKEFTAAGETIIRSTACFQTGGPKRSEEFFVGFLDLGQVRCKSQVARTNALRMFPSFSECRASAFAHEN
jgi:hypothetical protein